ncbi:MAG: hypothetical protein NT161_02770 [Candidatus Nomurabacteria bacterium]|nr:hypothetical protein [Candidatus Nomurabacteria bacterium]
MLYEQKFLLALFLTLISEVPIVFVLVRYFYKYKDIKIPTIVFVGILASVLTLPYLWFVLPAFVFNQTLYVMLGETLVVLIEAIIYYKLLKLKLLDSLVISLIANIVSIILGLLFQMN